MYMEENADIRPAVPLRAQQTRPASTGLLWRTTGVSACKPFHHSFLSFPSNYHNSPFFFLFSFFNFIRHSAGCTVTAKLPISGSSPLSASVLHCWTAMVQTVVENSRLRPSGVKTSTCTKKKPTPPTCLRRRSGWLVGTAAWRTFPLPSQPRARRARCFSYTYKSLHSANKKK